MTQSPCVFCLPFHVFQVVLFSAVAVHVFALQVLQHLDTVHIMLNVAGNKCSPSYFSILNVKDMLST